MKKNSITRKVTCILMALLIAVSATACSGGGSAGSEATGSGAASNASGGGNSGLIQAANREDPLAPFEETVTVRTVLSATTPPSDVDPNIKPEEMLFTKLAKEKLNVNLEFMWAVPSEQYDQKLAVTLAAGDLPDVLNVKKEIYEQMRENELLLDLNPSMDLFYPTLKEHVNSSPETLDIFKEQDGRRLGIPQYWDPRRSLVQMGIRQDWLDKLGLKVPTTVEELAVVMDAFTNKDPDGNGKNDTYGIALNKTLPADAMGDRSMGGLFNMFGAYPNYWIDDGSGKLVAGETMPQCKDALKWMNEQYQKGTLDKEFITKDITKIGEEMANNKYGIYFSQWWYPGSAAYNTSITNDPTAKWTFAQIPGVDGPGKVVVDRNTIEAVFVATEKCKSTDAYVKLMNLSTMMETDPDTYFGMTKAEVLKTRVWNWETPFFFFNPMDINDEYEYVNEAYKTGNEEKLNSAMVQELIGYRDFVKFQNGEIGWTDCEAFPKGMGKAVSRIWDQGAWAKGAEIYAKGADGVVYNEYYGSATVTQRDKGATLSKKTEETFTKMAIGQESIDNFDKFVSDWNNMGGQQVSTEINEWYAANKK